MPSFSISSPAGEPDDAGCAYLLSAHAVSICGRPRRSRSSYCDKHHALCHLESGTSAEATRLREAERLAYAVGGRQGWHGSKPSRLFLERLKYVMRDFS